MRRRTRAGSDVQAVGQKDSYGRPFAMIVMPTTAHYTVVMECGADGAALVDQDQIDTWVAYWGQWLAGLSFEPGLVAASVTIETAPDLGARLEREVTGQMDANAPELARQVLTEVMQSYPAGSAQVSSRVAVTYSAASRPGAKRRSLEEMARELGTRLPGLTQGLGMTGAGVGRPMTAQQLAEAIRVAYEPGVQGHIDAAHTAGPRLHPLVRPRPRQLAGHQRDLRAGHARRNPDRSISAAAPPTRLRPLLHRRCRPRP
jgi:hypothetical protein